MCCVAQVALSWLILVPWITTWLYRSWMLSEERESYLLRIRSTTRVYLWADIRDGYVILALILTSFLSLMSFADFLRLHPHELEDGKTCGVFRFVSFGRSSYLEYLEFAYLNIDICLSEYRHLNIFEYILDIWIYSEYL